MTTTTENNTPTSTSHSRNPWKEMRNTQNQRIRNTYTLLTQHRRTLTTPTTEAINTLAETLITHAAHPNQPTTETPWHHTRRESSNLTILTTSNRVTSTTGAHLPIRDHLFALAIALVESLDEVDRQTYTLTPA